MRSRFIAVLTCVAWLGCAHSDAGVTASVKTKLAADQTVKARHIDVDTKDRIVTLTGQVQSAGEKTRAVALARETKGVADVVDQLTVVPSETVPTSGRETPDSGVPMPDAAITADVKTRLLADASVSGLKINVDTQDRVVTLKGTVNSQAERDRAVAIAREVKQVAGVRDELTVRKQQ